MHINTPPFIVGIDLGTTNSAVAFAPAAQERNRIEIFRVPQLTGPGEFGPLAVLPSFLYLPGDYDIDPQAIRIPWPTAEDAFVGTFARDQGASVPARLVSSAKSWLCHPNVDRKARILPWGTRAELKKRSPVQATAAYLEHIKRAWNHRQGDEEELFLEHQAVVITVPASFDEVARELTLEAAQLAGYPPVTLLEEPLAAFYSWLTRHETQWPDLVRPDELILICDVGGGTTDFTLVTLKATTGGGPRFERIAVGDHLLLGGDNMDLALARRVEMGWGGKGGQLSADRWTALCHQCRQAKEQILSGAAERWRIALAGKGSRLIGDALTAELDRQMVEQIILEGFFPLVDTIGGTAPQRQAIAEFGLPYEPDPAISRHLIRFLERHRRSVTDALGKTAPLPDLVLFNGGVLGPRLIQEQIIGALRHWFTPTAAGVPRVLENPAPDLAVALGAAYYGLVKIGRGVRVGSGAPRSYYLGVARAGDGPATPQAICLVERGVEEGAVIELPDLRFEVLINQPVRFDLYSSSYRSGDRCGQLVAVDESLSVMPPLQTVIQYGRQGVKKAIPVRIEAHYSEVGTLALYCRSLVSEHRWQLQFQLRAAAAPSGVGEETVLDEDAMARARGVVVEAFKSGRNALEAVGKQIARAVDLPREQWPLSLIRDVADALLEMPQVRQSSPFHEARWLNLTGFCLRPGLGHGLDPQRVQKAWRIYGQGPLHGKNRQVRCEWWIMWRRLAAGLSAGQQRQISQDVTPLLNPLKGAKFSLTPQELSEVCMALANLERLSAKDKSMWGRWLLKYLQPVKSGEPYLWALARLGARELLYGPADRVIPPQEASDWIEALLARPWRDPQPVGRALAQLARKTGDRTRDLGPNRIDRILVWMESASIPPEQRRCLSEVMPLARQEEQEIFGESLPAGLVLHGVKTESA